MVSKQFKLALIAYYYFMFKWWFTKAIIKRDWISKMPCTEVYTLKLCESVHIADILDFWRSSKLSTQLHVLSKKCWISDLFFISLSLLLFVIFTSLWCFFRLHISDIMQYLAFSGGGNIELGEWEVQIKWCKISSKMYYTTWRILSIFVITKWKAIFKNFIKYKKHKTINYITYM